jgi:hypothetical protein
MEEPSHHDSDDVEQLLCPHCLRPTDPVSNFCHECDGPKNAHSAIDPMGQVYTAGHTYRVATDRPIKLVVLLGLWLFFSTQLLLLLFWIAMALWSLGSIEHYDPNSRYVLFFSLAFTIIYCLILYKTTWAYILTRRRANGLCTKCKYDLRGSKGQPTCPECGCEIECLGDVDE